jgi:predicted translin family RNA/ssDNA-binding protein
MRLVKAPLPYPNSACAVTNREDGELVDFQKIIDSVQPKPLHMKREVVEQAGRFLGMVPATEVEELKQSFAALSARLDEIEEDMKTYAEFEERLGRNKELTPA